MTESNSSNESFLKKGAQLGNDFFKGSKAFNFTEGYKYAIKYAQSGAVNIVDTTVKGSKRAAQVFRIDRAHKGVNYNHLNINPKISGLKDPHLPLPPGSLEASQGLGKVCTAINTVALPLAIAVDTARTGYSIYEDYKNDSTRNTIETVSNIAGGWGGGYGGAVGGAALGSAILPGVGTIIGGIIGGIGGGIGGSIGLSKLTTKVGDELNYGIIEKTCKTCEIKFRIRKYLGQDCDQENCMICYEFLNSFCINDEDHEVEDKHQDQDDEQEVNQEINADDCPDCPHKDKDNFDIINAMYEADYQDDEKDENIDKESNVISKKSD